MDHLRRQLAPVTDAGWEAVEAEATRTLRHFLAARPLVDFHGPQGWDHSARNLGRTEAVPSAEGVELRRRLVQPLLELRTSFTLEREELDAVDRGSANPDLSNLIDAARRAAMAEDRAVFHGHPEGGIVGMTEASPHSPLPITDDYNDYPRTVAQAVATLRTIGVGGPYGIALGPRCYTGVIETTEHGGYPVLEHIRLILGGPIMWAAAVDGAVVVSLRGGDYALECGQDLSLGYLDHTDSAVRLYFEESLSFAVNEPAAAVALVY
ncbi:MAG TPA: family 1 encapsulin nanocompartment shell protein [Acidimicrobiales bacterium]|nr:family 1 encapsulin nanocompartment shell protein [Acidimicrobiales bacterium]